MTKPLRKAIENIDDFDKYMNIAMRKAGYKLTKDPNFEGRYHVWEKRMEFIKGSDVISRFYTIQTSTEVSRMSTAETLGVGWGEIGYAPADEARKKTMHTIDEIENLLDKAYKEEEELLFFDVIFNDGYIFHGLNTDLKHKINIALRREMNLPKSIIKKENQSLGKFLKLPEYTEE